jgi:eukaryotic-like serine/threonine-protein kinase
MTAGESATPESEIEARLTSALGERYVVERELSGGGMARVFLASDRELERRIVLKVLSPDVAATVSIQRFQREIKLAASLQHANIVPLLAAGDAGGIPYYTMPFVEGQSLRERLEMSGKPPFGETLTVLRDVARALAYAHDRGVVHRDIKPENILLAAGAAVVSDFGIAKALASAQAEGGTTGKGVTLTQAGTTIGTPAYMAPEQIAADPAMDHRADIYAFGCVAYELVTGRSPFQGQAAHALFAAHLSAAPVPIGSQNSASPPALNRLLMRCLEKDPSARPQSAGEILEVLNRITAPSSRFGRIRRFLTPDARTRGAERSTRPRLVSMVLGFALIAAALTVAMLLRERAGAVVSAGEWVQLTDFVDGASWPVLSPDGRVLAFTRGPGAFMIEGQVYVKLLPDGDALQLTNDSLSKVDPAFSPDGARIAYGVTQGFDWQTWTVPLFGGEPQLLLRNSTGLRWVAPRQVMYSEITTGMHMQVVTARESGTDKRPVYVPEKETWMAHRSVPSPDGRHVLVAEMDVSTWMPCRVVPSDGSSAGWQVGPLDGGCNSAAWAPDGRTIYVTSNSGGRGFHIWRQAFPRGRPQQLTFGPTEEQGVAVAPDGRSLITSAGEYESAVWLHTPTGDRQISSEGFAYAPYLSIDGGRVYYIQRLRGATDDNAMEHGPLHIAPGLLKVTDLRNGRTHTLFPDFAVVGYSLSPDEQRIAVRRTASDGTSEIWVAPLDRRSPPRRVAMSGAQYGIFRGNNELVILACSGPRQECHAYRQGLDGSEPAILLGGARVANVIDVSPDGRWLSLMVPVPDTIGALIPVAMNVETGEQVRLCDFCAAGWSRDGRYMLFDVAPPGNRGTTWAVPIPPGRLLPPIPAAGFQAADVPRIPGARRLQGSVGRSTAVDSYVASHERLRRNLYRIPLR